MFQSIRRAWPRNYRSKSMVVERPCMARALRGLANPTLAGTPAAELTSLATPVRALYLAKA
jgi:hypothetical protein